MVLMGILLGCAGSAAMDSPSPAHAMARPAVVEHKCMGPSSTLRGVNDDVKEAAAEGWELVAMWQGIVCFKRPVG